MKAACLSALCILLTAGGTLAQSPSAPSAIPPRIPVRDFFRNPVSRGYDLSPDGRHVSFLQPWESRLNIFIRPIEGKKARQLTLEKNRDVQGYFWKGNEFVIYAMDDRGDENFHLKRVDVKTGEVKDLTPFSKVRCEAVDDLEDVSNSDILFRMNRRDPKIFDTFRLNVHSGKMKLVAQNPGNIDRYLTDHAGKIRAATTTDGVNTGVLTRPNEKAEFKTILTTNFRNQCAPQFYTFDNKAIYATSNIGRDKSAIVVMDPDTAKETQLVFENPEVDVSSLEFSKKRNVLTFATYHTWKVQRKFFDPETESLYKELELKLPGYEVEISAHDKAEERFIVIANNDRTPGARYLFEKRAGKLTKLVEVAPWLREDQLAPMKPIEFKSRDGLTLHGYLTLPLGREPKNLPVVVNPHGGPWLRDTWGYNPEVQFLANRGYAVFQVNFRGSTGYGRKFWELSFKQWGRAMQDDITDGVEWLIGQGTADPKRVAIYGGSYGGYATLQAVTSTPDLYAAGVDYCGISNLFTFLATIPPYWKPYLDMLHEMLGDPERDTDLLTATSPALNAGKIKTPLLVAQGTQDPRVNKAESDQIVDGLRKRGIEVEYIVKDNEGHGFHNEENKLAFYEAMEKFLDKHLQP